LAEVPSGTVGTMAASAVVPVVSRTAVVIIKAIRVAPIRRVVPKRMVKRARFVMSEESSMSPLRRLSPSTAPSWDSNAARRRYVSSFDAYSRDL
jgi:hypothetical protein